MLVNREFRELQPTLAPMRPLTRSANAESLPSDVLVTGREARSHAAVRSKSSGISRSVPWLGKAGSSQSSSVGLRQHISRMAMCSAGGSGISDMRVLASKVGSTLFAGSMALESGGGITSGRGVGWYGMGGDVLWKATSPYRAKDMTLNEPLRIMRRVACCKLEI